MTKTEHFICGVVAGIALLIALLVFTGSMQLMIEGMRALAKCELTLPRNENCVISAIPEKEVVDD